MVELNYEAMQASVVAEQPFPHLLVRHFVSTVDLEQIAHELPAFSKGGSFPIDSLHLDGKAAELLRELEGDRFRCVVADRFEIDLRNSPTMVTLRGLSREKDGRVHRDSDAKRVTVLLYLNPRDASWARQEGCLRLLRTPNDLEDYVVEVPPVDGTLLVFPNGPGTWHGHKQFVGKRYVVQLNYMANDNAAKSELRRHRLSALLKRLVPSV